MRGGGGSGPRRSSRTGPMLTGALTAAVGTADIACPTGAAIATGAHPAMAAHAPGDIGHEHGRWWPEAGIPGIWCAWAWLALDGNATPPQLQNSAVARSASCPETRESTTPSRNTVHLRMMPNQRHTTQDRSRAKRSTL